MSIEGGLGANTGGAVSVTSGVGTADDSGSMTIATPTSLSSANLSGNMTLTTGTSTPWVSRMFTVETVFALLARGVRSPITEFTEGWQHSNPAGHCIIGRSDHRVE